MSVVYLKAGAAVPLLGRMPDLVRVRPDREFSRSAWWHAFKQSIGATHNWPVRPSHNLSPVYGSRLPTTESVRSLRSRQRVG